ncbi:MAG: CCA tRNA nucleotidyltransferase [Treponema sp.]|uniref:CCA tRNA nucleotidyltransferase n=1 Tax=Treponema sp. TaxID=166 RepID=UPI00298EA925|nr:CCA tRNA nucleotidyltransferase [Treponema sp.]MCR5385663.1 CCA tRNA nucleotidyltransferase [Treponema sp.]
MKKIKIPYELQKFNEIFSQNGYEAYLVGGAVRDALLGKEVSDWDVTTNAKPDEVMKIFKKVIPTGIEHGTVTVHFMKKEIEVTTFRTESDYSDGRHPDKVEYCGHIEEDLSRRDFTINAIAASLKDGTLVDPYGGQDDLKKKIIRTVGKPHERFMEDGLRPVRALRFASKLEFSIEKDTYSEIFEKEVKEKIASISLERFRDEFVKMMSSRLPSLGLKLMEETGILNLFLPELTACRGCIQKDDRGYHVFDVMDHNMYACDGAPKEKPLLRIAALLHDSGKPLARTERNEQGLTIFNFYNHEKYSVQIARKIMTRLKFSNAQTDYVCHLIENHMFHYESSWSDAAVRRFIVRVGTEYIEDLIDLRLADMYGKYNQDVRIHDSASCALLVELLDRVKSVEKQQDALSMKDLKVNGRNLMQEGIPAGKNLGRILNELFETVLDDPAMNDRDKLLNLAVNLYKKSQGE